MNVLITGASGFLGHHLMVALQAAGHSIRGVARHMPAKLVPGARYVLLDFNQACAAEDWSEALVGTDVVINAVGILKETRGQCFEAVHTRAPQALFTAAARAGVSRIIQISALGADAAAQSDYHRSKWAADEFLADLPLASTMLYPSLVYGPTGRSAAFFGMTASLPLIPLPGRGQQQVQPVHVDDVVDAVLALVQHPADTSPRRLAVVGPEPLALRDFYAALRAALSIDRPACFLPVPMPLVRAAAHLGGKLPGGLLDADTLAMLERGSTADAAPLAALLRRAPRAVADFIPAEHARAEGMRARLAWLLPLLRWSIALVWIVTAIVSFGVYPVEDSYALLAKAGVPSALLGLALYGAALMDLVFGLCALLPRRARWLWLAQLALVLGYTAIITLRLPEFWLHPYGPVLKNLPFLAALWMLYELDPASDQKPYQKPDPKPGKR